MGGSVARRGLPRRTFAQALADLEAPLHVLLDVLVAAVLLAHGAEPGRATRCATLPGAGHKLAQRQRPSIAGCPLISLGNVRGF
tara:strand:+ start:100 stop:351 length:252 start_codon:yes stop_codon:yes gene_type:complete